MRSVKYFYLFDTILYPIVGEGLQSKTEGNYALGFAPSIIDTTAPMLYHVCTGFLLFNLEEYTGEHYENNRV